MANENQSEWHMDTAVMNQTIWAVQDFILDAVISEKPTDIGLTKRAVTEINKTKHVGLNFLEPTGIPVSEPPWNSASSMKAGQKKIQNYSRPLKNFSRWGRFLILDKRNDELIAAIEEILKDMDVDTQRRLFKALMRYQNIVGVDLEKALEQELDLENTKESP